MEKHSRSLLCLGPVRLSYAVGNALYILVLFPKLQGTSPSRDFRMHTCYFCAVEVFSGNRVTMDRLCKFHLFCGKGPRSQAV